MSCIPSEGRLMDIRDKLIAFRPFLHGQKIPAKVGSGVPYILNFISSGSLVDIEILLRPENKKTFVISNNHTNTNC